MYPVLYSSLVQRYERYIDTVEVTGSIPVGTTKYALMVELADTLR